MPAEAIVEEPVTSANLHGAPDRPVEWVGGGVSFLAPILLLAAALLTYAPALLAGFVWDDQALILRDPLIRSPQLIWEGFQHFLFTDAAASDFYRPLQRLSYTLDYAAFFLWPGGYHLVSILWHATAAIALFYFAGEFLARSGVAPARRWGIAFCAALVWLAHPVQSAAVVYISGRADPLAAAFGFCALYLGLRMLRANGNGKWAFGLGAGGCFLASALSKEMGLIFLLVWVVLVGAQRSRQLWLGTAGLVLAVLIAYLGLRLPAEHLAPPPARPVPALVRPVVAARALAEYAGLLIFPLHLHMEREVESRPTGFNDRSINALSWRELQTLLGLLLFAAAGYALWWARRHPAIFLSLLFAAVSYLPVSGVVRLNASVAEHWLYLPSAFLFLALAAGLGSSGKKTLRNLPGKLAIGGLAIWFLFLPLRTFARTFDWRDQRTFLTRTIASGGDSARMLINLSGLELSEGHLEAARRALEQALAKEPGNLLAQLNFAAVEIKERKFPSARARLAKITDPPELQARAQESLAVLENRESGEVNLLRLRLAARLGAANWEIEKRYIKAVADSNYRERAIHELKTCITEAPYRAESWFMMSELLRKSGRPNEAAVVLAEAEANDVHLHERMESPVL